MVYALFFYISGVVGDANDQRKVLTVAFGALAVLFTLQSLPGFFDWTSHSYFYAVQILIGVFNALIHPSVIDIMGNWFPKKNRGFIVGLWGTCTNVGNIIGI